MQPNDTPKNLTYGYRARVDLDEPTLDPRDVIAAPRAALDDWVQHQIAEGRDVIEHNGITGEYRMRPLRPNDV